MRTTGKIREIRRICFAATEKVALGQMGRGSTWKEWKRAANALGSGFGWSR